MTLYAISGLLEIDLDNTITKLAEQLTPPIDRLVNIQAANQNKRNQIY